MCAPCLWTADGGDERYCSYPHHLQEKTTASFTSSRLLPSFPALTLSSPSSPITSSNLLLYHSFTPVSPFPVVFLLQHQISLSFSPPPRLYSPGTTSLPFPPRLPFPVVSFTPSPSLRHSSLSSPSPAYDII